MRVHAFTPAVAARQCSHQFHRLKRIFRYDGSTKEASFSIGLQGISEEDTERVKLLISQTIDDIIEYAEFITLPLKHLMISWIRDTSDSDQLNRNTAQISSSGSLFSQEWV